MSQELAVRESEIVITDEQVDIMRKSICQGATDDEMRLYFYDCRRRGVHPMDRLIHFTKRKGKYTPITSIDFLYQRAHATGEFTGQEETVFRGEPGEPGFSATVRVHRGQGVWPATARWEEYYPGDGDNGFMWRKFQHRMLEKCAEALALRKAFTTELHGLYIKEEMDQADAPPQPALAPSQKKPLAAKLKQQLAEQEPPVIEVETDAAPFNPEVPPPAEVHLNAGNICQQFRLSETLTELVSIMNQWQEEASLHTQEERMEVNKVFAEAKKRLGKR